MSTFAQDLAKLSLTITRDNCFGNGEYAAPSKVADLTKAYAWLIKRKSISKKDLESTAITPNKETLTGLDLLKMTLNRNYADELKKASSLLTDHHQAALSVWDAMEGTMGKKETLAIWAATEPKSWIRSSSLASLMIQAAQEKPSRSKETIKAIYPLIQKLRGILPKETNEAFGSLSSDPNKVAKAAKAARRKDLDTLLSIESWPLGQYALLYYLTGHCPNKEFNEIAKTIPTSRDIITSTRKPDILEI